MLISNIFHKEISFLMALIMILLVLGAAVFFIWHNNGDDIQSWIVIARVYWNNKTVSDFMGERNGGQAQCLSVMQALSDQELMDQFYDRMSFPTKVIPETGEDKITMAHKIMVEYLICRVGKEKDKELYNNTKEYIYGLKIQDKSKQSSLEKLDDVFFDEIDTLINQLALGDIEKICPVGLPELCASYIENRGDEKGTQWCRNICVTLEKYATDEEAFETDITGFKSWNPEIVEHQYRLRSAIAYRIGGRHAATQVCGNLEENDLRTECLQNVDVLDCIGIRNDLDYLMCAE